MFVLRRQYCCFRGSWAPFGCQNERKQSGIPIWIKTWFYDDFGSVLKVILISTSDENSIDESMDFEGIPGETPVRVSRQVGGNGSVQGSYNNIETGYRKT